MSIQNLYPNIAPTLNLSFALTKALDPRISFSRASTATYYGTQTAKAEENLLLQSQDFTTSWSNVATSDTADTTVAPDGTTTADTITATGTGAHYVQQTSLSTTGTQRVLSCFVKAGTNNYVQLGFGTSVTAYANFDVTSGAGAVGTVGATATASIVDAGNGWFRCIAITSDATASALCFIAIIQSSTDTRLQSFVAAGTETIILWGAQLEQRDAVTAYTPTTTQPITNYIPVLETAASSVARFDHNPTTFESLGLLIEESRTNLLTYSEEFDNAAWTKTNATITANTLIAPDGALTGDKIVSNAASLGFTVENNSQTSGVTYTWSTFAKAAEYSFCQLRITGTVVGSVTRAYFNLATGTVSGVTNCTASITPVGNGWYRCSIVYAVTSTAVAALRIYGQVDASDTVGDGYSGIYIWGAQLEEGAFATSYIPTVASQVTRASDAASMTGTNFSSWYNQAEGTFFSSVVLNQTPAQLNSQVIFAASDNTNSNRVIVSLGSGSSGNINALVTTGGVTQAQTINGSLSTAGAYQYANAYKVNDFASVANGGVAATDTSGTIPVVDRLYLGVNASGTTTSLTATIRKIAYYPLRVTNAQLQALTS